MSSTYVARVNGERQITIDKSVWLKEDLNVGDYVEVTVRKVEKTTKSEPGSPYSQ
jgi:bifunctional DNA-binding transcriptional regulator/antitoxin component of YhaV-PrlF toxin-antitoxin module